MKNFLRSFLPVLKKIKKYKIEIFLLGASFFIAIFSLILYQKEKAEEKKEVVEEKTFNNPLPYKKIFVDVAGAVKNPGVYEATFGARLKDVLDLAGGLSDEADKFFFQRNFNLAKIVIDQEKIYIPSTWEVQSGIFVENQRTLDYTQKTNINWEGGNLENSINKININQATAEELETLPGIGKLTAQKIIKNRPYQTIDELLTKKVISKSTFEKIKDLISL
jgi:competence protein ComEA